LREKKHNPLHSNLDENLTKVVEGKEFTLSFDELKAEKDVTLNFKIKDHKTGRPITNL
jgi:hypothetical protein